MTAVVGLVDSGRVYIGADSAATGGWHQTTLVESKVWRAGPYAFGCAGSIRAMQLLRHVFDPPAPTASLDRFLATTFADAVRVVLKDGGHVKISENQESSPDSRFIVGVAGRLFIFNGDLSSMEPADRCAAIGCGDEFALGALHATAGQPPKLRIRAALAAAEHFSAGVRGPFVVTSVKSASACRHSDRA